MITATDRPPNADLRQYRKTGTIHLQWKAEPFSIETREGGAYDIGPHLDDWQDGYWVAWPDDGSAPYPIAPEFAATNYEPVAPTETID